MLFNSEIRKQTDSDPRGPVAAIVITDLPPEVGVDSNYTELLILAAAHQLAPAIDHTPPPQDRVGCNEHLNPCRQRVQDQSTKVARLPDNGPPNDPPSKMELPAAEGSTHEVAPRGGRESLLYLQLKRVHDLGH
jgi:hypothetical protein